MQTGLLTSGKPFLRTPKCADPALLSQALRVVWQETTLLVLCILAIASVAWTHDPNDPAAQLWMVMLIVQSLPYAATVLTACLSAVSNATLAQRTAEAHLAAAPQSQLREAA